MFLWNLATGLLFLLFFFFFLNLFNQSNWGLWQNPCLFSRSNIQYILFNPELSLKAQMTRHIMWKPGSLKKVYNAGKGERKEERKTCNEVFRFSYVMMGGQLEDLKGQIGNRSSWRTSIWNSLQVDTDLMVVNQYTLLSLQASII